MKYQELISVIPLSIYIYIFVFAGDLAAVRIIAPVFVI